MTIRNIAVAAVVGGLLSVTLLAQTAPITNQQTFTTGLFGFIPGQTAQLNVLNLAPVPLASATATAIATGSCAVTMQFVDSQNVVQNSMSIVVAPQKAASVTLPWSSPSATGASATTVRREIRGVVVANPIPTTFTVIGPCTLKITMEIYDSLGSTVASTSDTSLVSSGVLTPLK